MHAGVGDVVAVELPGEVDRGHFAVVDVVAALEECQIVSLEGAEAMNTWT